MSETFYKGFNAFDIKKIIDKKYCPICIHRLQKMTNKECPFFELWYALETGQATECENFKKYEGKNERT